MKENSMYEPLPVKQVLDAMADHELYALLENNLPDQDNRHSYIFSEPVEILECSAPDEIEHLFAKMEKALDAGLYLAGFMGYEMGYFLEPKLICPIRKDFPLAWFGAFKRPIVFDHSTGRFEPAWPFQEKARQDDSSYHVFGLSLNMEKDEYKDAIEKIKRFIEKGDTYQVNFTLKYKFRFSGWPQALYIALRNNQSVAYSAFIRTGSSHILSLSPELFFQKRGDLVSAKPMKGTARRGRTMREDEAQSEFLANDLKNRSENIMIVDLLRNDLGRLAKTGTVKVKRLFEVEKYETLFQMTSTIQAEMKNGVGMLELFRAIFPCGSVTGAPKVRTMEIIRELEKEERGVYTGSIGFITPERDAKFNVAIRTVVLERDMGEMGIGSGIVYDSDPEDEYNECVLKGRFLSQPVPEFSLIETMLWQQGKGYYLLEKHLERLKESAGYFKFLFSEDKIENSLKDLEQELNGKAPFRVRLLLSKQGHISLESAPLKDEQGGEKLITLSSHHTDSSNRFLFHKTTMRHLYDSELEIARSQGFFEVIFRNENDEITEGAFTNIFIRKRDIYYTPPVEAGLLDGVFRKDFMEKNPGKVMEAKLKTSDLINADQVFIANSVRGLIPVKLKIPEL